jgi:acyl-CoA thioesterase-1
MEGTNKMKAGLLALALCIAVPALATAQVNEPPLSATCDVPNADIATPVPLPRLAEKLGQKQPIRILAIGSSSTRGIGATAPRKTYPAQLKSILDKALNGTEAQIINRGVSGELAQVTAERLRTEVALEKPDVVLWQVGTNDALSRVAPSDFENTVRSTVKWLQENKIDLVLVGVQYTPKFARDDSYFGIREALRNVAASEDVLYVRRYDAMQYLSHARTAENLVSGDDLHLNDLGYQCMAEHVARSVIASLFLKRKDLQSTKPVAPKPPER